MGLKAMNGWMDVVEGRKLYGQSEELRDDERMKVGCKDG